MGLSFATTIQVRVRWALAFEDAIAEAAVGEPLILALDEVDGLPRIWVVSQAKKVLGWLPPDDPVIDKLRHGAGHQATFLRTIRGRYGPRFDAVIIEVTVEAAR